MSLKCRPKLPTASAVTYSPATGQQAGRDMQEATDGVRLKTSAVIHRRSNEFIVAAMSELENRSSRINKKRNLPVFLRPRVHTCSCALGPIVVSSPLSPTWKCLNVQPLCPLTCHSLLIVGYLFVSGTDRLADTRQRQEVVLLQGRLEVESPPHEYAMRTRAFLALAGSPSR